MVLGYIYTKLRTSTFSMDLNMMIFFLLVIGWILHGTPIRHMRAFHDLGIAFPLSRALLVF